MHSMKHGGCPWMVPVCALPDDSFVSGTQNGGIMKWSAQSSAIIPGRHFVWSLAASGTAFASGPLFNDDQAHRG